MNTQKKYYRKITTMKFFQQFFKNKKQRINFYNKIINNKNKQNHFSYKMFEEAIFGKEVPHYVKLEIYTNLLENKMISLKDYPNLNVIF